MTWSSKVTVCTHGGRVTAAERRRAQGRFQIRTERVKRLEGGASLRAIRFVNVRDSQDCSALFFCTECEQRSRLPHVLGCKFDCDGSVLCKEHAAQGVPGLFVAGNVRGGVHLAITAAAEGAEAGIAINDALLAHDRQHGGN